MFSFGKFGTSSYPDDIIFFQRSNVELQVNNGQDGSAVSTVSSFKNSWKHFAAVIIGVGVTIYGICVKSIRCKCFV